MRVNLGKKGTRTTVGMPGTGLSYSIFSPKQVKKETVSSEPVGSSMQMNMSPVRAQVPPPLPFMPRLERRLSILLAIGIFLMPYFLHGLLCVKAIQSQQGS